MTNWGKVNCPKCGVLLDTIDTLETLAYWDGQRYKLTEPSDYSAHCPECKEYIGDDPKIKEVLDMATS